MKKVLAIASSGGHWVQLRRLRPAWEDCAVTYVTTKNGYRKEVFADCVEQSQPQPKFYPILDANRWQKVRLLWQLSQIIYILLKVRPNVIVSTGAAPGFFAFKVGKLIGARTIWIDSIANAQELSLSGRHVRGCADLWLTQWPELASINGAQTSEEPGYAGSVI